jgi:hypothetical protein
VGACDIDESTIISTKWMDVEVARTCRLMDSPVLLVIGLKEVIVEGRSL